MIRLALLLFSLAAVRAGRLSGQPYFQLVPLHFDQSKTSGTSGGQPLAHQPPAHGSYGSKEEKEEFAPFEFSYTAKDENGSTSSREESADGKGTVTGKYSILVEGLERIVEYVADKGGFRATVKTNEPGTKSDSPADISLYSSAPEYTPPETKGRPDHYQPGPSPKLPDEGKKSAHGHSKFILVPLSGHKPWA
ncbi:cuticle protein 14-like [Centruroides vittatus]|uniref:cuticle protein 14-like n=1 Tax=Centruroides vittatus TaxID=120091 RepID=UPI00351001D2